MRLNVVVPANKLLNRIKQMEPLFHQTKAINLFIGLRMVKVQNVLNSILSQEFLKHVFSLLSCNGIKNTIAGYEAESIIHEGIIHSFPNIFQSPCQRDIECSLSNLNQFPSLFLVHVLASNVFEQNFVDCVVREIDAIISFMVFSISPFR